MSELHPESECTFTPEPERTERNTSSVDNQEEDLMPAQNEPTHTGGTKWDEYEAAVRTPEDVRRWEETMKEEKEVRVQEIIRERRLAKFIRLAGGGK